MLLSVIIPFYHVEKYFDACLLTVSRLPRDECEILLVDDCGRDGSLLIAQRFVKENDHMRILRRERNGGLSAARNTGLAQACGEYVYFLDSDDLLEPDALMHMVCQAKAQALDIAKGRFRVLHDVTGTLQDGLNMPKTDVMPGGELFAQQCRAGLYEPMVWQCAYRRAFLKEINLTMAEGILFEDELFETPALIQAARAAAFDEVLLTYRHRQGSIMASFAHSSRWCESYLNVCRRLYAFAVERPKDSARRALQKRIGQIAVSVAKNIEAYGLAGDVRREAEAFLAMNRRELADYALHSGDAAVALQGAMLWVSPRAFMRLYARVKR